MHRSAVASIVAIAFASSARAAPPEAPAVGLGDWLSTGSLAALALTSELFIAPPDPARWRGGILADDPIRDGLRLGCSDARRTASTVSDVLLVTLLAFPIADAGVALGRGQDDGAGRMLLIDLQALSAASATLALTRNIVGRERPFQRACDSNDPDPGCGAPDSRRSFVSGHTALAFVNAGLVCTQHAELDLWGGGAADDVACGLAVTTAVTVGVLRIVADKHYATDVLGGALVGVLAGFVLPRVLHYGFGRD